MASSMKHLVIAGTEKSGTTSVYHYLGSHPEVCPSIRKETDYFRKKGDQNLREYLNNFKCDDTDKLFLESSPGYLAESKYVCSRMLSIIPDVNLLFILRDPIERLISSFTFHKSRLNIPQSMDFDIYVKLCMEYENNKNIEDNSKLDVWQLRVPSAGLYASLLGDYFKTFPHDRILVLTQDMLKKDPVLFMKIICKWVDINESFYENYSFDKANVTFLHRNTYIQNIALKLNEKLEPFFTKHKYSKKMLLKLYKLINAKNKYKPILRGETIELLRDYYHEDHEKLKTILGQAQLENLGWLKRRYE